MAKQSQRVAKSNPEMQAVLANIDSLVDELQSLSMADGFDDGSGEVDDNPPPVRGMASAAMAKADEAFRTPAATQVATEPDKDADEAGMAHWDDELKKAMKIMKEAGYDFKKPEDEDEEEEVKKALALMKSIQSSDTEGPDANEDAEDRLDEIPEPDEENIEEVKKALMIYRMLNGKSARKAAKPQTRLAKSMNAMTSVAKSMAERIQYLEAVNAEILEGLGIANTVTKDDKPQVQGNRSVQKSAPIGQYGNELGDIIGQAVAKALSAQQQLAAPVQSNRPSGWDSRNEVQKNLGEVAVGVGRMAGYGMNTEEKE